MDADRLRQYVKLIEQAAKATKALIDVARSMRCQHEDLLTLHNDDPLVDHKSETDCRCMPQVKCLRCGKELSKGGKGGK